MQQLSRRIQRHCAVSIAGLATGYLADRLFGDPAKHHPVAMLGTAATSLIDRMYADSRSRGVLFATIAVGLPTVATAALSRTSPVVHYAALSATTWAALGGTTLATTGERMANRVESGDLESSRELIPWLCSRDPQQLDLAGVSRATVESLAENTSDAVTGTLLWGAVCGAPGVVLHRCANTLDAMVGYRTEKWNNFGWASAVFDDAVNYLPARWTGLATVLSGPNRREAIAAWRRDAGKHPSPNAGIPEATAAAALGVTIGGRTEYFGGVEDRPTMGQGPAPRVADVRRAVALTKKVQDISLGLVLGGLAVSMTLASTGKRNGEAGR
ncbi:adenosylcobinamide-phosphate synthase CbiB [Corynebacterium sp. H78]|uniref:adenosylcobinamide-phosphate synthase CbiB n=1 Tax=Corynebacterium sp. H78 TaxID=3133417 RepID=UPI00309FE35B